MCMEGAWQRILIGGYGGYAATLLTSYWWPPASARALPVSDHGWPMRTLPTLRAHRFEIAPCRGCGRGERSADDEGGQKTGAEIVEHRFPPPIRSRNAFSPN